MLYVEQRYHFRSVPGHCPWGGITPAQAEEARQLCRKFGLRLLWATNTLGHCDGLLSNDYFRYLAEDVGEGEQICPSHPDTRPLMRQILSELASVNPNPVLHIGGDEARALNLCPRCRKRGMTDGALYLDHMQWAIRETKKLGKRPAIWGDMLLLHPKIIPQIDPDTLIFDWHYTGGSADTIRLFQKHGLEVVPTTASQEWARLLYPFTSRVSEIAPLMRDARELRCRSICLTTWELGKGALMENQWERIAAAPAIFEDRPLDDFARRLFGSARADQIVSALFSMNGISDACIRRWPVGIAGQKRGLIFRHGFGLSLSCRVWQQGNPTRIRQDHAEAGPNGAFPIARSIQRAATRHKTYVEHLDLPLRTFEAMHDRLEVLGAVREAVDRLHPHRLPNAEGTRLLRDLARKLTRHVVRCESLAARFEGIQRTRGGSHLDGLRLRRQIGQLKVLCRYVTHHMKTYRKGVPVPTHELWQV